MFFENFINRLYNAFERGKVDKVVDKQLQLNTSQGVIYWTDALLEKCIRIFEWKGLPFEQKVIELPTLTTGYSGFTFDSGYNGYIATMGSLSGVTPFPEVYDTFVYACPKCSGGSKPIYPYIENGTAVIINNDALRNSIMPLIRRYAVLLANADSTIRHALINARYDNVMIAESDSTRESMQLWRKKVEDGEVTPIINRQLTTAPPVLNVGDTNRGNTILQAIEARENIMRMFLSEIGIRQNKDKRGNMVADEVAQNDMSLLFNVSDMLKQRQTACKHINTIFDLNVSVKLSSEYNLLDTNYDGDN